MECAERPCVGRREASKQERRQAIVEIAQRSFLDNGYAGTSMSAIAAELGGSKGTLWSYFPSKEELFAAVLDDATIAFRSQLNDVLANKGALATTIPDFCCRFITKITSPEGLSLHRLVVAECARFPEIGEIFSIRGPEPVRRLLADYFASQMDLGLMRQDDPGHVAAVLVSLCMGDLYQRMIWEGRTGSERDIAEEADYVAQVFLRAFARQEATQGAR